jgi:hypothetical protein
VELYKFILTLVKLGAGFAYFIQCLQEPRNAGCVVARLAVEAVPRPDRTYYRDDDPLPEAPEEEPTEPREQVTVPSSDKAGKPTSKIAASSP